MHRLHLLGLNHTTAALELRERLAFDSAETTAALKAFADELAGGECVILSTCNRVEIYASGDFSPPQLKEFLGRRRGVAIEQIAEKFYQKSGRAVVEHLFSVASSLDSMVLGETQILGQVRQAYDAARSAGVVGKSLNPLFQYAIATGKQVMRETALGEGRLSIASVAVDFARLIFDHFHDKTVMGIGAGKMGSAVLRSFAELGPRELVVCNRDGQKAKTLAGRFAGRGVSMDELADALVPVDIVVSSTGSAQPILTARQFTAIHRRRRLRPIFLIDIAMPRDIEPAIGEMENVYLYNIDDLQQVVSRTQAGRREAIEAARKIVATAVGEYLMSHRLREIGPMIDRLYKRSHELALEELSKSLGRLPGVSAAEREHLEELARRIVNKLLHDPVQALRQANEAHAPMTQYIHAMEQLFKLGQDEAESEESR